MVIKGYSGLGLEKKLLPTDNAEILVNRLIFSNFIIYYYLLHYLLLFRFEVTFTGRRLPKKNVFGFLSFNVKSH